MNDYRIFLYGGILLALAVYKLFFSKAEVIKRKLNQVNGKRINTVENNEIAKVVGEIKYFGKTVTAPLSGRKCVYYHILVEQQRAIGKAVSWDKIIEEQVAGDVIIKDGSYYAVINTGLVESHLIPDRKYSSGIFNTAAPHLKEYLERHRHKSTDFWGFNKPIRYKEGILEENEMIAVAGKCRWTTKNQINLKIPNEKVLLISADDEEPVYLSDDPDTIEEV